MLGRQLAAKDLAVADVLLPRRIAHDRTQRVHLVADRAVADPPAGAALAGLVPPDRIAAPAILAELSDLKVANIVVELVADVEIHDAPAVIGDLAAVGALFLEARELLGHLAEFVVEDRHFVLDAKAQLGVLDVYLLAGLGGVGRLERDRHVAGAAGQAGAAIPAALLHIGATK